jgi:DNA mismatch endonuclease, patch repair protein
MLMTDVVNKATRSRMMAGIKGKNTVPELVLRQAMHKRGFRFRLHVKQLHGSPDLLFPKYKAAVFVHGCFWHRHRNCRYATTPASRVEFWQIKFAANFARDKVSVTALISSGWRVAIIWECSLRGSVGIRESAEALSKWLVSDSIQLELGDAKVL